MVGVRSEALANSLCNRKEQNESPFLVVCLSQAQVVAVSILESCERLDILKIIV